MEKRARAVNSLFWLKQLENENIFLSVETGSHICLPYWISYLFDYFIIIWLKLKDPWTKHDHKVNDGCKAFMLKIQTTSTLFRTCAKVMHFIRMLYVIYHPPTFNHLSISVRTLLVDFFSDQWLTLWKMWAITFHMKTCYPITHPGLKGLIFIILVLTFQHPRKDLGKVFSYLNSFSFFSRTSKATVSSW